MKGIVIHLLRLEALSEGRLSVLRVPAKWFPAPDCVWCKGHGYEWIDADPSGYDYRRPCRCIKPPYAPGDYFVRETWTTRCPIWDGDQRESFFVNAIVDPSTIIYRADDPTVKRMWRSSVTMPEWASRYLMTLGPPVPCRLGDVTEEMAIAEGIPEDANSQFPDRPLDPCWCPTCHGEGTYPALGANLGVTEANCTDCDTAVKLHKNMWNTIYPRHPWSPDRWTWAYPVRRKR